MNWQRRSETLWTLSGIQGQVVVTQIAPRVNEEAPAYQVAGVGYPAPTTHETLGDAMRTAEMFLNTLESSRT